MKILKCDPPKGMGFDGRISETDFQDAKNVAAFFQGLKPLNLERHFCA